MKAISKIRLYLLGLFRTRNRQRGANLLGLSRTRNRWKDVRLVNIQSQDFFDNDCFNFLRGENPEPSTEGGKNRVENLKQEIGVDIR